MLQSADALACLSGRHENGTVAISSVYPNHTGTRVVFIDAQQRGWLYSPVDDAKCASDVLLRFTVLIGMNRAQIEKFPASIENVLWDPNESNMFVGVDTKVRVSCVSCVLTEQAVSGQSHAGDVRIPAADNQRPYSRQSACLVAEWVFLSLFRDCSCWRPK